MRKNFDKILLGLLWLMTMALATTLWMNVRYGFDIFSAAHWEYISTLQANRTSIKLDFYLSLILALCIALVGLYFIVRPRFRKIALPATTVAQTALAPIEQKTYIPEPTQPHNEVEAHSNIPAGPTSNQRPRSPSAMMAGATRKQNPQTFTPPTQRMNTPAPTVAIATPKNPLGSDINTIFESAGFVMKPCKRIGKLGAPIVALGYDQTLWIGTSDASGEDMVDAFQTLTNIFEDTLGDSANDITLRGCIISPTSTIEHDLISTFDNIDAFKQFMSGHQNIKPDGFDSELFDAISTYIGTVTNYIGKE